MLIIKSITIKSCYKSMNLNKTINIILVTGKSVLTLKSILPTSRRKKLNQKAYNTVNLGCSHLIKMRRKRKRKRESTYL